MKSKVLIINAPLLIQSFMPLGCAYIKSALKNAGYRVDIVDWNALFLKNVEKKEREFWVNHHPSILHDSFYKKTNNRLFKKYDHQINQEIDKIIKHNYKYVLFSICYFQKHPALGIAKKIKKANKNIKIIFGGIECLKGFCFADNYKNLIKENNFIDYQAYFSEGEKIIVELLDELENGKEIKTGGIIKRIGDQIIENPEPELIKDINSIPFPDWDGFDLDIYTKKHSLPIMSSRGCMNKCVFCIEYKMFKYLRVRTAENIFAEIERNYKKFGATHVIFNDPSINNNLKELEKLCDLLISSNINITFEGQANFNNYLSKNLLKKMNRAGCESLEFGLESGSQKVIDLMNKCFDIKKSEEVIRNAKETDIKVRLNIMFGFPGENEKEFQETLSYLKRNKNNISEVRPSESFTTIHSNANIGNNLKKFNIKSHEHYVHPLKNNNQKIFWETMDGKNNILVRLNRFERFCKLAKKLKINNVYDDVKYKNREIVIFANYKKMGVNIKKIPISMKLLRLLKNYKI